MEFNTHVHRSTVTIVKKSDKKRFQSNRKVKRLCFPNMAEGKNCERKEWYFVTQIVLTYCENCSRDQEKLLRSLEQSIRTVKGQNNFW